MSVRLAKSTWAWAVPAFVMLCGSWAATPAAAALDCDETGRFYVLGSVEDRPLYRCAALGGASDAATLSFSEDYRGDSWLLSVQGALAVLLSEGGVESRAGVYSGLMLTARPMAFYLEGEGTFGSSGSDGVFRVGLKSDLVFVKFRDSAAEDAWFDGFTVTSALYRQFDLDGASGTGFKTTIRPEATRANIGATFLDKERTATDPYFIWSPYLSVDALWNDQAGDTGLADNEDYLWVGLGSDFTYVMPDVGPYGARINLGLSHHIDLNSDLSATWGQASFSTALNKAQTAYLKATYARGTDYRSLGKVDKLTIGLGLRF